MTGAEMSYYSLSIPFVIWQAIQKILNRYGLNYYSVLPWQSFGLVRSGLRFVQDYFNSRSNT
jgi:hypothetical protein